MGLPSHDTDAFFLHHSVMRFLIKRQVTALLLVPCLVLSSGAMPADLIRETALALQRISDSMPDAHNVLVELGGLAARTPSHAAETVQAESARLILSLLARPDRIASDQELLTKQIGKENVVTLELLARQLRQSDKHKATLESLAQLKTATAGLGISELSGHLDAFYSGAGDEMRDAVPPAMTNTGLDNHEPSKGANLKSPKKRTNAVEKLDMPEPSPRAKGEGSKRWGWTVAFWALTGASTALIATLAPILLNKLDMAPAVVLAVIGAGAVIPAAVAVGVNVIQSHLANKAWGRSRQAREIVEVERARASGDAAALAEMGRQAGEHYERLASQLAQSPKRDDPFKKAEQETAFTSLVLARAKLNENAVSQDVQSRIGEQPPEHWRKFLAELEASAGRSEFEGLLALSLLELEAELGREKAAGTIIQSHIERFSDRVPTFSGALGKALNRATQDLEGFRAVELSAEEKLHASMNGAMRGRIGNRLHRESAPYRQHSDRRGRLATVLEEAIKPAAELAREIDRQLDSAIGHRRSEALNLTLAAANSAVPVPHTRSIRDSSGNIHLESYIVVEDHSFLYRSMAASDAASAKDAVASGNVRLRALDPKIRDLHSNATIQEEGLRPSLPAGSAHDVNQGGGGWANMFLPPIWAHYESMESLSQVHQARAAFTPILDNLRNLEREVDSRRNDEEHWVQDQIDRDVHAQTEQARRGEIARKPAV